MKNEIVDRFVASTPACIVDIAREEAARVCDETARYERGERAELADGEFSDNALLVALEVAFAVGNALKSAGAGWRADVPWTTAASLLRRGWQRGHKFIPHVVGKDAPS